MKRTATAAAVAAALTLSGGFSLAAPAAEPAPEQGTRLHFQKTLSIHPSSEGRTFAETRQEGKETSLLPILAAEYGVPEENAAPLVDAFRRLNPGVDPTRIPAGRLVRIPFKIEEAPAAPRPAVPSQPQGYVVRKGDSLWRILKNRYKVAREAMTEALTAVSKANPGIKDLNHLVAGQKINIPGVLSKEGAEGDAPRPMSSAPAVPLLSLLRDLGCRVTSTGESFLPIARGRTVRLDSREFPIVSGPTGRKVIFDPASRLSPALTRSLDQSWNHTVLQGSEPDATAQLEKLLPKLGFYELSEGPRKMAPARGIEFLADTRWTVVPREDDLWEGRVHLLLPAGSVISPDLGALAVRLGYSIHLLGGNRPEPVSTRAPLTVRVPELSMSDPAQGEGALLKALGIPYRIRPDVECDLGGGVRYHLRPEITFDHGGILYAVAPAEPRRAESLLARAGYFTMTLPEASQPLERLGDLLAILGVPAPRTAVEVPAGQGLRLRVEGLSLEGKGLVPVLYPGLAQQNGARILLTRAQISSEVAGILVKEGVFPWAVIAPDPPPAATAR